MSSTHPEYENPYYNGRYRRSVNIYISYDDHDIDVVMKQYGCMSFFNYEFLWKGPDKAITSRHNKCTSDMRKVCIVLVESNTVKGRYISKKFLYALGNIMRYGNAEYKNKGLTGSEIRALRDITDNIDFYDYNRYRAALKGYSGDLVLKITLKYTKEGTVHSTTSVTTPIIEWGEGYPVYTIDGELYTITSSIID